MSSLESERIYFPLSLQALVKLLMAIFKKIYGDFMLSGTRVMDRICYFIVSLLGKAFQVLLLKVGKMTYRTHARQ